MKNKDLLDKMEQLKYSLMDGLDKFTATSHGTVWFGVLLPVHAPTRNASVRGIQETLNGNVEAQ